MRTKIITYAAVLLCVVVSANAVTVYAPNGLARPYPFSGPDDLVMFDSADPASFTIVGSMNVPNIGFGGLDFDAAGDLWAYASFFKSTGGSASGLYSVDINTGQATLVGNSNQPLDDLAYNPVNNTMYGLRAQFDVARLYTVDLTTGATSLVGEFTDGTGSISAGALAIDSQGDFYLHSQSTDRIYKAGADLVATELYALTQDTFASQGITIDWSRDDQGYHGAVGRDVFPDYFSQINYFETDGSSYVLGPDFGPLEYFPGDQFGYPKVEPNDLAIPPIPEPATLFLFAMGLLLRRR